jgi:Lon protease-like protein
MFPLSTVLFPHARLPLQVFEPRYRSMVAECLAGDGLFGVVLIARGSEVGGGDQRVDVATLASIETAEARPDGRWHLVVVGLGLLRVTQWLEDDPYPRARVEPWDPAPVTDRDALQGAEAEVRRVRGLLSELGEAPALPGRATPDDDPDKAAWRLCGAAPIGVFDRQQLLEAPSPHERLALLIELVRGVGNDLDRLLAGG